MKLLISWSGEYSKAVAITLRNWLPEVIHNVDPWMSASDIAAGDRWGSQVQRALDDARFGVICVTPENLTAPWLMFEAGALSKAIQRTYVCPFLIGLSSSSLSPGPLAQFQAKEATKEGAYGLVGSINLTLGKRALPKERLEKSFKRCWPELEASLIAILARPP
jgi:TIR domain